MLFQQWHLQVARTSLQRCREHTIETLGQSGIRLDINDYKRHVSALTHLVKYKYAKFISTMYKSLRGMKIERLKELVMR